MHVRCMRSNGRFISQGFGNPWEDFYRDCDAIIFVVDSSDRYTISEAASQLHNLLNNPLLAGRDLPVVCLANKADKPDAVAALQMSQMLQLEGCADKRHHVTSCDSLTGDGFGEALDWLARQLKNCIRPRDGP